MDNFVQMAYSTDNRQLSTAVLTESQWDHLAEVQPHL